MADMSLDARLELLLAESLESIRERQTKTLDQVLGGFDRPFVLFGAGNLGHKALTVLGSIGRQPQAFIDNNSALWGTTIGSVPVMSPSQLRESTQDELPGVITTIWCGEATDRMVDRHAPLKAMGFDRIALFGHLAWRYPQRFLPHYSMDLPENVVADATRIRQAFALLGDETSRRLFVDHVQWRLFLDYDLLPPASSRLIYFDDFYSTEKADEVVYDIGAFNGDSVLGFLESGRSFREIHSFEPSSVNFKSLQVTLASMNGKGTFYAHQLAVGDISGDIFVESHGGPAARVGSGSERVAVTTLDEFTELAPKPSFIKIDIEGFEPLCLTGGRQLIAKTHPVIAVCVYHQQDHLWTLLLQLHDYFQDYTFSLCPHLAEGWDLVLYAVPPNRVPLNSR